MPPSVLNACMTQLFSYTTPQHQSIVPKIDNQYYNFKSATVNIKPRQTHQTLHIIPSPIILRILIYQSDACACLLEKKTLCKFLAIPMICLQRSFPTCTDAYREKDI